MGQTREFDKRPEVDSRRVIWPRFRRVDWKRPLSPYEALTGERFHDHLGRNDLTLDRLLAADFDPSA
jgi:hypothetical protein